MDDKSQHKSLKHLPKGVFLGGGNEHCSEQAADGEVVESDLATRLAISRAEGGGGGATNEPGRRVPCPLAQ